jgi:hypothetical protein
LVAVGVGVASHGKRGRRGFIALGPAGFVLPLCR